MKLNKNTFFKMSPVTVLLFVCAFVLGLAFLVRIADQSRDTSVVPYSTFLKQVEENKIKKVVIRGSQAIGHYTDGKRFEAVVAQPVDWKMLQEHNVEFAVQEDTASSMFTPWIILLLIIVIPGIIVLWRLMRPSRDSGGSGGIFSVGKSRAKMFKPSQIKFGFDSVAGADEAKEELQDIVAFLKNPDEFKRLGARLTRGVLMVGEPGTGKTLLAKAVAGEANVPFFSISGSDFVEMFVGVGAARIRDLFAQARKHAPCIIFIDEIDSVGRQRGTGVGGGHDEREQTLNQLLAEMDGFDAADLPIVILAATNTPNVLDKALLRPGRFDRRITVPFPDEKAREEILRVHARAIKVADDVDFAELATNTAGFSGADLENLVNQAALHATKNKRSRVEKQDFDVAYKKLLASQESSNESTDSPSNTSSRARMYLPSQIKADFSTVAGVEEAKEELQDVIDFLKNPEKYREIGAKLTNGVLLVGDPGNGKTMLARAVAGEANVPFFSASGSEFIEQYVGVGAARMRDMFAQARKKAPCIIFIDEIDAIGAKRGGFDSAGKEQNQTLNQMLTEMDGFDSKDSSVIVLAATNRVDILDKALLRPGRFDRQVYVPYPDLKSRQAILEVHAKKVKLGPDVDLSKVARGTPGFSGADLANLINEAAIGAAKRDASQITVADLEEARDKILLGKERKSVVMSKDDLKTTAYHEAGHALVSLMMPNETDPLHKITIIPRGQALGVAHFLPERDKVSQTKAELLADIAVSLGGRIAEELVFGNVTTGARADFQNASAIARRMVMEYGMSDELGPISYPQANGHQGKVYSEGTAQKIDQEVRVIVDQCWKKAFEILKNNRDKLDILAKNLLEKETLFADEVYELLGITPRAISTLS